MTQDAGCSEGGGRRFTGNKAMTPYVRASIGSKEAERLAEAEFRLKLPISTSKQAFYT
jgi:hypothetical protein